MKRTIIITSAIVAFAIVALFAFNKIFSKKDKVNLYAEAKRGLFEITVSNSGELLAESSVDIRGPELVQQSNTQGGSQGGSQGGGQGGGRQGGGGGGGHGVEIRMMDYKITDIVPEGTTVKKGDYIATLDRSTYTNSLNDAITSLATLQSDLELRILDTAMSLTSLRDEIKNQRYTVEEAVITLEQSKFEPPATIRKAELDLNKQKRALDQKIQAYTLRKVQIKRNIDYQKYRLQNQEQLVQDLQNFLAQFTIKAPADGMVIYKKDRMGNKRKTGSSINAFDNVVATLPDLTSMLSKVFVSEIEVTKVLKGQPVNISVDAFPNKTYNGTVMSVANIGEVLPNSDAKMFEVMIKVDGSDINLRPAMTTWNKIILKSIPDAVYIPLECVQAGVDSVQYVYKKNKTRQIVVLGEVNEKNIVVEKGLEPGTLLFVVPPEDAATFRLVGENLIK